MALAAGLLSRSSSVCAATVGEFGGVAGKNPSTMAPGKRTSLGGLGCLEVAMLLLCFASLANLA